MKFKRILSALSAAALSAALCAPTSAAAAPAFPDTAGHEAEDAINLFARLGIIAGMDDGTFQPDRTINRAEMCTILDRIFSYIGLAENTFPDLLEDQWFTVSILKANAAGVILGDERGVRPMDTIRWDEAVVMIGRAFRLEQRTDVELPWPVAEWAQGYVAAMWEAGYLPEREDLEFTAPFTRADTVTVLDRVISDLGWEAAGKVKILTHLLPIDEKVPARTWDKDAFYSEEGRTYYDDGATPVSYGVDVSRHQEEIDWQAVADDGIEFAMLRIGGRYWGSGGIYDDLRFEDNLAGAQDAGLDVGVYFFSQAITPEEAVEEAEYVLEHLAGRPLTYPVVYDWENVADSTARTAGLDTDTLNACAVAFCETVAAAGYQPMVYFNGYIGLLLYELSAITDYPFWYAGYNETPDLYYDFRMWQYTSSGSVAGIEGKVDMDICFYPYGSSGAIPQ